MQKTLLLLLAISLRLGAAQAQTQQPSGFEIRKGVLVVCPARPENMFTRVAEPAAATLPNRSARRGGQGVPARITVTYTGFTPEAQAAFQHAINIWQSLLFSPVPIHVNATWSKLKAGVLGSAGSEDYVRNFTNAPQSNVWYPIALAEKIAGQDLNGAGEAEIAANFTSRTGNGPNDIKWYYGLDARPGAGEYDLVTVVLHELCHGLGFVSSSRVNAQNNEGSYGAGTPTPFIFDTYMETRDGQRLVDTGLFTNPSAGLGTEFTGDALFFDSPLAAAVNPAPGDKRPQLYAPGLYNGGSSVSHLDENVYPAGDPFSLMSPQVGAAEAIHDPGLLTRKMFDEMGWFITAIRHTKLADVETPQARTVTATVESDGTVTPGSVKLFYAFGNGAFTEVTLTPTGTAGQYQGTIPNPGTNTTVRYYLSAADNETGRTYTNPGGPSPGISTRTTFQYVIGPDATAPVVRHTPPPFLMVSQLPYQLVVRAEDNLAVASVVVNYSINGQARPALTLVRQTDGVTYLGSLSTAAGPIVPGDVLRYSVVATDQSARANTTTLGPYTVPIVALTAPQAKYVNNFNAASRDFVGTGFSITTPEGFSDAAIHSNHPYADRTTLVYQLLVPIVVASDPVVATVNFNEIVLVEPSTPGSSFGSPDFFDFVVVEGSLDGQTWTPLADGYNSRNKSQWLTAYNASVVGDNSTAVGTPDLFLPRTLNLRDRFSAGATVQLRFRLFADDGARGWGWAIDNLSIQGLNGTGVKDRLTAGGLNVFPNPSSTGELRLRARLARPTSGVRVQVRNVLGQTLLRQAVPGTTTELDMPLRLSTLPTGLYFVSLEAGAETVTRKVVIQK